MVMETVVSVVLLILGVIVLIVIHVCIVTRLFEGEHYFNGNTNTNTTTASSSKKKKGMSKRDLKKLPCFEYKVNIESGETSSSNSNNMECVVCLDNFRVGDRCKLLPNCEHSFHAHCIDSWLLKSSICPICRACVKVPKIVVAKPFSEETGVNSVEVVVELT